MAKNDDKEGNGTSGKSVLRSARGLFAATGKKSEPIERIPQDFYPTPVDVTRALIRAEGKRLDSFDTIWEPAAGDGAMMFELNKALTARIIPSDIIDRGIGADIKSFFDYTVPPAKAIVTNPPFSLVNWRDGKGRWITHALGTLKVDYMALLLPWTWPGAGHLGKVWDTHPPSLVYLLTWKVDFTGQGAPPQNNAWWIWDRGHRGETIMRRLDRRSRQGELF